MQLLTYAEIIRRLDPTGALGITRAWVKARVGYVKVGKKHAVPDAEVTALYDRLMDECRANQPRPASSGAKTSPPGSSDGASTAESGSIPPALAIANKLKKLSRRGKPAASQDSSDNVVVLPTRL